MRRLFQNVGCYNAFHDDIFLAKFMGLHWRRRKKSQNALQQFQVNLFKATYSMNKRAFNICEKTI